MRHCRTRSWRNLRVADEVAARYSGLHLVGNRQSPTLNRRALLASADAVFVSAASIWEIAITTRHTAAVASLPLHHRDPFDRLLLAQSMIEPLRLITTDHAFTAYGVSATEL